VYVVLCAGNGGVLGVLPPLVVESPWWPDVEPVVVAARDSFGVRLTVLRLLDAQSRPAGGTGAYLAEVCAADAAGGEAHAAGGDHADAAGGRPALPYVEPLADGDPLRLLAERDDPLRMPWARPGGVATDVAWADRELAAAGTPLTGPAVQVKSWNLSSVVRLPASGGTFWCKHVPPFSAHEGALLAALAASEPDLVPAVVGWRRDADGTGTVLLRGVPGVDQWKAPEPVLRTMLRRWIGVQARWAARLGDLDSLGLPDWRRKPLLAAVRGLVGRADVRERLTDGELASLDELVAALPARLAALDACGLPPTLVHGDLHPGNWIGDGEHLALVDWSDSGIGHPMLDTLAFLSRVPAGAVRERLRDVVVAEWTRWRPDVDAHAAMALVEPVTALLAAVVYRTFVDGIEASERPYHADDVPAMLRLALAPAFPQRV
jgi:aminoglycoside phosphotransferase (APT) family kinase protein